MILTLALIVAGALLLIAGFVIGYVYANLEYK
jgi:hypothetical protein